MRVDLPEPVREFTKYSLERREDGDSSFALMIVSMISIARSCFSAVCRFDGTSALGSNENTLSSLRVGISFMIRLKRD